MKKIIYLLFPLLILSCSAQKKTVMPSTKYDGGTPPPYRLQSGDKVELIVTQRPDLSGEYQIGPDGSLSLPLAGNIEIRNLTREQAEAKIDSLLKNYYSSISIMLKIKSYQSNVFYVIMGEVKQPGLYPVTNQISLLKAFGTAQGFTEDASISSIQLVRNAAEKQVIKIDLEEIMRSGDFSEDYILQKDDVIYVPRKMLPTVMYPINQILPLVQVALLTMLTINQIQ